MTNRIKSRLGVEALESRQLMSANFMGPLAPHAALVGSNVAQRELGSQPMSIDYGDSLKSAASAGTKTLVSRAAVVQQDSAFFIANNTNYNITFYVHWQNPNGTWTGWQPYTLPAHYRGEYWDSAVGYTSGCLYNGPVGLTAQIYFNTGNGTRLYNLSTSVVNGKPAIGAGMHYEFLPSSTRTVDLYTGG